MKIKKTLQVTSGGNYLQLAIGIVSSLDEGVYDMIIMDKDYARSHDQNSLLWGVIYKGISDTTGYSIEEVVEQLVKEFNADTYRIKDKNGTVIKLVKDGMEVRYENKKNTSSD